MDMMNDEQADQCKIFVGGLSWETDETRLYEYFSQFGYVTHCLVMKNPDSGKSRGFGFVTFRDPNSVKATLSVSNHHLDGRNIDPKECNIKNAARTRKEARQYHQPKIFLGGLPINATESALREVFSQYGKVTEVIIMYDQEKKKSRGFGFLSFESEDSISKVVAEQYVTINGKKVEVKRAEPQTGKSSTPTPNGNAHGHMPPGMPPCFAMTPWGMWPTQPPFMPTHHPVNGMNNQAMAAAAAAAAAAMGFNPQAYQSAAGAPVAPGWGFPFPHWGYPQGGFPMAPQHGNGGGPPPPSPHGHANHHPHQQQQQQQQQQLPNHQQQQAMNAALAAAVAQQQHAVHGFMPPGAGAPGFEGLPPTVPTPNSVSSQNMVPPGGGSDGNNGGNGPMPPGLGFPHQGSAVNSAVFLSMRNNANGAANGQVMAPPPPPQGANGYGGGNGGHPGFSGNNSGGPGGGGGPSQHGGPQPPQQPGVSTQQQQQHPDPAQILPSYQAQAAAAVAAANANSFAGSRGALPGGGQTPGYHPYRRM